MGIATKMGSFTVHTSNVIGPPGKNKGGTRGIGGASTSIKSMTSTIKARTRARSFVSVNTAARSAQAQSGPQMQELKQSSRLCLATVFVIAERGKGHRCRRDLSQVEFDKLLHHLPGSEVNLVDIHSTKIEILKSILVGSTAFLGETQGDRLINRLHLA
jgi:hypothetical protein